MQSPLKQNKYQEMKGPIPIVFIISYLTVYKYENPLLFIDSSLFVIFNTKCKSQILSMFNYKTMTMLCIEKIMN